MAAIKSSGNKDTELKLIAIFRAHGIKGWRRHQKLVGRPDFVFPRERLAVFVDGCFWHGCPQHGRKPGTNASYWVPKLARNKERDVETTKTLRKKNWRVLRLWEHELSSAQKTAARISKLAKKLLRSSESLTRLPLLPTSRSAGTKTAALNWNTISLGLAPT
jgi:DNA mismatch endonuclease, patch repair protein